MRRLQTPGPVPPWLVLLQFGRNQKRTLPYSRARFVCPFVSITLYEIQAGFVLSTWIALVSQSGTRSTLVKLSGGKPEAASQLVSSNRQMPKSSPSGGGGSGGPDWAWRRTG